MVSALAIKILLPLIFFIVNLLFITAVSLFKDFARARSESAFMEQGKLITAPIGRCLKNVTWLQQH